MRDQKQDDPFSEYQAGEQVPLTGLYKCGVNGEELTLEQGEEFPDCEPATDENATWVRVQE